MDNFAEEIKTLFETEMLEGLKEFIRIPNLSRDFDPNWATNGLLEKAGNFVMEWITKQQLKGLSNLQLLCEPDRTPFILGSMEGSHSDSKNIFFYGHIDKQPHLLPWQEGLSPVNPVIKDGRLYGRGSSDDGYCPFAAAIIIKVLQRRQTYPRFVFLFEADEETESKDLIYYMQKNKDILKEPDMLICLDSGAGNYDQMWVTTSLRGIIDCQLKVKVLNEGVHSGMASGLVPSCFRIARELLNRLEDVQTGEINKQFQVDIPPHRLAEGQLTSQLLQEELFAFPIVQPQQSFVTNDCLQGYLNSTWKSQLEVTGLDGLPPIQTAGNVQLPEVQLKLSLRTPPTLDNHKASEQLKVLLEQQPPYNSQVTLQINEVGNGYNVQPFPPQLQKVIDQASLTVFNKPTVYFGMGGSIPFIELLGNLYPKCILLVTGVLGPGSNAHGPDENLHIQFTQQIMQCVCHILHNWQ